MDAIKKIFKDDHKSSHKEEIRTEIKTSSTATQPQIATAGGAAKCEFGETNLVNEAQRLKQEACQKLQASDATLAAAQAAQAEVERAAARANIVTNQALRQEVEGQRTLVEAGQKLMEAGAQLQQEAAHAGSARSAETVMIQKGAINQATTVDVAKIPSAEMHVLQNRVVQECRPVVESQMHTEHIETVASRQIK